jgi:hypothetical protein
MGVQSILYFIISGIFQVFFNLLVSLKSQKVVAKNLLYLHT